MIKEYPITPVPKPRMTMGDRRRKDKLPRPPVKRYWDFCLQCKLEKVVLPCFGVHVTFILLMPNSWSEKKKLQYDGKPHMNRPDVSNLLKALEDAVYEEDSAIYDIHITKLWGRKGSIIIEEA